MKIFLAKYEHKHGTDEDAFSTRKMAEAQLKAGAEEYVGDWEDSNTVRMTADYLIEHWTDITGGNEFLYVDELPLNNNAAEVIVEDYKRKLAKDIVEKYAEQIPFLHEEGLIGTDDLEEVEATILKSLREL